jgi:hypothetical protein
MAWVSSRPGRRTGQKLDKSAGRSGLTPSSDRGFVRVVAERSGIASDGWSVTPPGEARAVCSPLAVSSWWNIHVQYACDYAEMPGRGRP